METVIKSKPFTSSYMNWAPEPSTKRIFLEIGGRISSPTTLFGDILRASPNCSAMKPSEHPMSSNECGLKLRGRTENSSSIRLL